MRPLKNVYRHFEQDFDDLNMRVYSYFRKVKIDEDIDLRPLKLFEYADLSPSNKGINSFNTNNKIVSDKGHEYLIEDFDFDFACAIGQYVSMVLYHREMVERLKNSSNIVEQNYLAKEVEQSTKLLRQFETKKHRC